MATQSADIGGRFGDTIENFAHLSQSTYEGLKTGFGAQQPYLLDTSYGTVSSSYLARNLGDQIDGAIHTSTFTDPRMGRNANGTSLREFDWSQAKTAQLFVHHKDDPCDVTRYQSIIGHKKDIPLITVEGIQDPRGDACEARTAHGFVGRGSSVMKAIGEWITQRRLVAVVGQTE